MRPLLVVIALPLESQGLFEREGVPVLYTGIGKVNAAWALTRALGRWAGATPTVVNFGTAGSPTLPTGSVVACRRFVQRDIDLTGLGFALGTTPFEDDVPAVIEHPALWSDLPDALCASGDRFETGPLEIPCDVVEMEAYALAKVCLREGVPFGAVKYITDGADQGAAHDWQANLPRAAAVFLDAYRALSGGR